MNNRVGFMQGRLSPLIDGRIQAFPWPCWRDEFVLAQRQGFGLMEWTLDHECLYENPLLTVGGQSEIKELCRCNNIQIPSLTGDCFMQAPFWKAHGENVESLKRDFRAIVDACAAVGISMIVVPLVDNGAIENSDQEDVLVGFLKNESQTLSRKGLRIIFESNFSPRELARFIGRLDPVLFGINYDIGNSAALGFDPNEEFDAYGNRIVNVHVKDRVFGGTTVPLGTGAAKFETVFSRLAQLGYAGNYILQTARATDGEHAKVLSRYRDMTKEWLSTHAA